MSVIAYTGLPGHGKSYSVVENCIIPALKQGRVVAHNLELNHAALSIVCGREVESLLVQIPKNDATPDQVVSMCPPGAVIILDEVWRYWGAGLKASDVPRNQLAFFKEHRHRVGPDGKSSEIVIIDQELGSGVARFIRDLVEITYIHHKLASIGASGRFRVDVYSRAQNAGKPNKGSLIRKLMGKYKPEVWNCYTSHTQKADGIGDAGLEQMPDGRAKIWQSWPVRASALALLSLFYLIPHAVSSFNGLGGNLAKPRTAQPQTAPVPTVPANFTTAQKLPSSLTASSPIEPPAPAATLRQPSALWRLVGVVYRDEGPNKGEGFAVLISATGRRVLDLKTYCERTFEEGNDYTCELDGEWVTRWSGSNLGAYGTSTLVPGTAPASPSS